MNRLFFALCFAIIFANVQAQDLSLAIVPRYTYGLTIPAKVEILQGQAFSSSEFRTKYVGTLIGTDGQEQSVAQATDGLGLDIMLKYANPQKSTALGLFLGLYRQKYLLYASHPEFPYKGHTLSGSVSFYKTIGVSGGFKYIFPDKNKGLWFVQMNGYMSLSAKRKGTSVNGWNDFEVDRQVSYLENGTGTVSKTLSANNVSLAVGPEVGFTNSGPWAFELSLSYQHPLGSVATEQDTHYQRNRLFGAEKTTITQQAIFINLRLPITVHKFSRMPRVRTPKQPRAKTPKQPKATEKPAPPKPPVKTDDELANYKKNQPINLKNVIFALGESKLLPSSNTELDKLVNLMKDRPAIEIRLEGHTDRIGGAAENLQLSKDRVKAVKDYLVSKGIKASRIETIGYGDTRTICSPPCQENRRVEVVVTKE